MARKIEVEILGDSKSLQRAFSQSADSGSKFGRALGGIAKAGVIAAGAVGIGAVFGVLKAGIPEFAEAAKVAAQTEAVIKSTGGSANVTAKQVDDLASSIMRKTGIDDEAVASGENMLLTFTNIRNEVGAGNDIFNQSTRILADMSTALGTDMSKSAIQLGKALNDPVKGVTALTRVGVTFTAGQKEQIAAMVKAGDTMGAQKVILQELNKEFGGSAEAIGKTLPGQLNVLKESFNNLAGSIVGGLAPAFASAISGLTGFVEKLSAAKGFRAKFNIVWEGIENVAKDLKDALVKAIQSAIQAIDWSSIGGRIRAGMEKATSGANISAWSADFGTKVQTSLTRLSDWVNRADWQQVGEAITKGLAKAIAAATIFLAQAVPRIALGLLKLLASTINARIALTIGAGKAIGAAVIEGVTVGLAGLANVVRGKLDAMRGAVAGAASAVYGNALAVGKAIVNGIIGGLGGLVGRLKDAVESGIRSALSLAGKALPGSGPFEITRHIVGKPLAEGVIGGFVTHIAAFGSQMSDAIRTVTENMRTLVESRRAAVGDAWSRLAGDALSAFDAVYGKLQTKSERALAQLEMVRTKAGLKEGISSARTGLAEAQAGGDQAAILAAQKQLDDALYAQKVFDLQRSADKERVQLDAAIALKRRHFEDQVAALQASFTKQGATTSAGNAAIIKLLNSYGVSYKKSGKALGEQFAEGMEEAQAKVIKAAKALAAIPRDWLFLNSPAKKGPLSDFGKSWWASMGSELASGINSKPVTSASTSVAGSAAGGSSGGGTTVINLVVDGKTLAQVVQPELIKMGKRNGSALGGFA